MCKNYSNLNSKPQNKSASWETKNVSCATTLGKPHISAMSSSDGIGVFQCSVGYGIAVLVSDMVLQCLSLVEMYCVLEVGEFGALHSSEAVDRYEASCGGGGEA
eukprot:1329878-Amorphochlora_amoeboformis.AAC.1